MLKQAIILAGGLGTRLGAISKNTPKPLLEVNGRPFLDHIILNIREQGVEKIILSVGYLAEQIISYFGDGASLNVDIEYVIETAPAGTGGALILSKDKMDDNFFVLNGDTIFDIDYNDLARLHMEEKAMATIALREVDDSTRYGNVGMEGNKVISYAEKKQLGRDMINGGIYAMQKEAIIYLPSLPCSLENDLFPVLITKKLLSGKLYDGFFLDIGIPDAFKKADHLISRWQNS